MGLLRTLSKFLVLALCLMACSTLWELDGKAKLKNIEKAIEVFEKKNNRMPKLLEQPQRAQKDGRDLEYSTDVGRVWSIAL